MTNIKEEFLGLIVGLQDLDISKTSIFKATIMLRDSLVNEEIPLEVANTVVSLMTIEVDDDFIDDVEFSTEVMSNYAKVIYNIYETSIEYNIPKYIETAASKLFINYGDVIWHF